MSKDFKKFLFKIKDVLSVIFLFVFICVYLEGSYHFSFDFYEFGFIVIALGLTFASIYIWKNIIKKILNKYLK